MIVFDWNSFHCLSFFSDGSVKLLSNNIKDKPNAWLEKSTKRYNRGQREYMIELG